MVRFLILILMISNLFSIEFDEYKHLIMKHNYDKLEKLIIEDTQFLDIEENGYSPLTYASRIGSLEAIKLVFKDSKNINKLVGGKNSLFQTIRGDHSEALSHLIDMGGDIEIKDSKGRSLYDYAYKYRAKGCIELILKLKGEIDKLPEVLDKLTYKLDESDGPYVFVDSLGYKIIRTNSLKEVVTTYKDDLKEIKIERPDRRGTYFTVPIYRSFTTPDANYSQPDRIFATSDNEGNFLTFTRLLKGNGVIDEDLNWTYGKGSLLIVGDMVDRGEYVTELLWLLYKLDFEAKAAGGNVHILMGNHELMNLRNDARYVVDKYHALAEKLDIEFSELFSKKSILGSWMRSKNIVEKVGDHLIVHGGISSKVTNLGLSLEELNSIGRSAYDRYPEKGTKEDIVLGTFGLTWYRGLVREHRYYEKATEEELTASLDSYGSKNVIIGHCIVDKISSDYNGKVLRIDLHHPWDDKTPTYGLFIEDGKYYIADDKKNLEEIK